MANVRAHGRGTIGVVIDIGQCSASDSGATLMRLVDGLWNPGG